MDISNNIPVPKITYITPFIQERRKKHCTCKNRTFTIDLENREVICNICGSLVDPFDVLIELSKKGNRYDSYLESQRQYAIELDKWFKKNRIPIEIKQLVEKYRFECSMGALPECPHCRKNFNFTDIKCFSNPKFRAKGDTNGTNP